MVAYRLRMPGTPAMQAAHPFCYKRLRAAYVFNSRASRIRNLARWPGAADYAGDIDVMNQTWVTRSWGTGLHFDNSDISAGDEIHPTSPDPGWWHDAFDLDAFSWLWMGTKEEDSNGQDLIFAIGGSADGVAVGYKNSPNTMHMGVATSAGSAVDDELVSTSTFTNDAGEVILMGGRYDAGSISFWLNGVEEDTGSVGTIDAHNGAPGIGGMAHTSNAMSFSGHEWGGTFAQLLFFEHALTDQELGDWFDDPWAWCRPAVRIAFPAAAGGSVTPDPVVATWSAVAPFTSITPGGGGGLSPVVATWSAVAPLTTISTSPAAVSLTWSAVAPTTGGAVIVTPDPVVATWSAVAPASTISTSPAAVSLTWSAVAPASTISIAPDPVSLTWSAVAPASTVTAAPAALVLTWSAVAPASTLAIAPAALVLTWSVVVPTVGNPTGGPYCVEQVDVYTAGAVESEAYRAGAAVSEAYTSGTAAADAC